MVIKDMIGSGTYITWRITIALLRRTQLRSQIREFPVHSSRPESTADNDNETIHEEAYGYCLSTALDLL